MIKSNKVLLTYYVFFTLTLFVNGLFNPVADMDMVPYVASALHYEINDINLLHSIVYSELKQYVSSEIYNELTTGSFRNIWATSPEKFIQLLPFFEIRPLYTGLIFILYKIGFNIYFAAHFISAIAIAISLIILYLMTKEKINLKLLYLLPIILLFFGIASIAARSNPAALNYLFIILFMFLFLRQKYNIILYLLPILITLRTDLIIFVFLVYMIFFIYALSTKKKLIIYGCISLIIYLVINQYFDNYGYATVFYYTFIEHIHPAEISVSLTFNQYFDVLIEKTMKVYKDRSIILICLALLISSILVPKLVYIIKRSFEIKIFMFLSFSYVVIHFLLFPLLLFRMFAPFYTMFIIALFMIISQNKTNNLKE